MQPRQSLITTWCDRIVEGGWLLALVFIPSYFNLLSSRHFEPDKATSLRAIVVVMLAAALIGWAERRFGGRRSTAPAAEKVSFWQHIRAVPLAIPTLLYIATFIIATVFSVTVTSSVWGSYQRLQGTYTNLAYITLGALVATNLRRREQLERLVTVMVLGSIGAVGYGLSQHLQIDPLPWRGDVITRVASTMGNSIFVAAYLIMVLPFALARAIGNALAARTTSTGERDGGALWGLAYGLIILGSWGLLFGAIKFGAVVRTSDLRYWWVYPGAILVGFGLYLLPAMRPHAATRRTAGFFAPGVLMIAYLVLVGLSFLIGQASGAQVVQNVGDRVGTDWPLWMFGAGALVIGGYAMMLTRPALLGPSRTLLWMQSAGMTLMTVLILTTIFFTQSRGPWIGGAFGLFVFATVLLVQAWRRARAAGSPAASRWFALLMGEVVLAVALGGFLVLFNTSNAPVFENLRQVPYIGRMGRLLEVDSGTGLVRRLIWAGDDKAGGAIGLITSNPLRTIIGWGPESMFVAYNPFYPPSLANIESRGASPDRSHQAYLDELVTKGALGLLAYLFVLFSFFALVWRLITRSDGWQAVLFFTACLSTVAALAVEGLTGIPIVVTLMLLWLTMGATVAGGALEGQYRLSGGAAPAPEPVPEPAAPQRANRGRKAAQPARAPVARSEGSMSRSLIYAALGLVAIGVAWFTNIDNVFADMRFQQGQVYTDASRANLDQQLVGMGYFIDAIDMEPQQDFYYLNLGRNLMNIADIRRQQLQNNIGAPADNATLGALLDQPNTQAAQQFIYNQSPQAILSYTNAVLQEAYRLSPRNKDNSANLARLHSYWYSRFGQDPAHLQQAIEWYARASEAAPQDVTILNEYAGSVALYGTVMAQSGDTAGAEQQFQQAQQLLERSVNLDPRYTDSQLRLAELLRIRGQGAQAVDIYLALLDTNAYALNTQIGSIASGFASQPEQLARLSERYAALAAASPDDPAYQRAIGQLAIFAGTPDVARDAFARQSQLQPTDFDALRNYTLALSDTGQYEDAVAQGEKLLALAQQQGDQQFITLAQTILDVVRGLAGG